MATNYKNLDLPDLDYDSLDSKEQALFVENLRDVEAGATGYIRDVARSAAGSRLVNLSRALQAMEENMKKNRFSKAYGNSTVIYKQLKNLINDFPASDAQKDVLFRPFVRFVILGQGN